ncbi:type II secretion system protein N [Rhodanobacter sp. L36]|uniref:type II secretion system protein N n=1 Tax=Rhodanobacter sp. L36 TaxID=1747221 RepID=UPI00131BDC98|nr:type II secretion system protein N [Rhodanobacter sp. L36]
MSYFRKALIGFGVLVLAALLLVWFLPARWLVPSIESRLQGVRLEQVQGSVWNGSVANVVQADGRSMGRLDWQLSRLALLGKVRGQMKLEGPRLGFSATMQRVSADQIQLDAASLHATLDNADQRKPSSFGEPRGAMQITLDHALLQGGWPLELQAAMHWHDAALLTSDGLVPLGVLDGQATAQGGIVQVQLHDDGTGPLEAKGNLQVIPLGWRLDATLRERRPDAALHRWLAQFGHPDSEGRIHIQRNGGLADGASTSSGRRVKGQP